jgi:hypothetical protein
MALRGWPGGLLLLLPALAACGGTEEPPPPPYYAELAALTQRLDAENTAADEALGAELEDARPAEVGDLFSRVTVEGADRLDAVLDEVAALEPPQEAEPAHDELLHASALMASEDRATAGHLVGLSQDELGDLAVRPDYLAAEERVDRACAAMQVLADDAGADVTLCVGMFAPPA